jgi:tetratricopeptide (TPR) repeat protein
LDSLSRNGLDSFQRGNYSGALYEFNMTDQMIRQKLDSDPSLAKLQAWVLANVGAANRRLGKFNEALASYEESIKIHEKVSGAKSAEMFDALHGLGHTYLEAGDPVKAEEYYTRAVNYLVANPTLIDQIYETANLEMIARLYRDVGRYSDAEPYFKRVLAAKQSQGDELETLKEMAQFYAVQNDYGEAQKYMLQAVELQEREVLGASEDSLLALRELADTYSELGEIYSNQSMEWQATIAFRLSQALQNAEISKRRTMFLQKSPETNKDEIARKRKESAAHLEACGDLFFKLNRVGAASRVYNLAVGLRILTNDGSAEGSEKLAGVLLKLGNLYRSRLKNFKEAEQKYQAALNALSSARSGKSTVYGDVRTQLGSLYGLELKKPDEGERLLKNALEFLSTVSGSEKSITDALEELANFYVRQSRFNEAIEASKRRLSVARTLLKRTSITSTGVDKWNAQEYADAFTTYIWGVFQLAQEYNRAGDSGGAQSVYSSLLDDQLHVNEMVDSAILQLYSSMLTEQREAFPVAALGNVAERIKAVEVRRKIIEAVVETIQ